MIIFLDFDGVVVHVHYNPDNSKGLRKFPDPNCVEALNQFRHYFIDPKIVIHSTWIYIHSLHEMEQKLVDAGLKIPVIGTVPVNKDNMLTKSQEIYEWFVQNDPEFCEPFVVIDDDVLYKEEENNWMFPCDQILVEDGWLNEGLKIQHIHDWMRNYHLNLFQELIGKEKSE